MASSASGGTRPHGGSRVCRESGAGSRPRRPGGRDRGAPLQPQSHAARRDNSCLIFKSYFRRKPFEDPPLLLFVRFLLNELKTTDGCRRVSPCGVNGRRGDGLRHAAGAGLGCSATAPPSLSASFPFQGRGARASSQEGDGPPWKGAHRPPAWCPGQSRPGVGSHTGPPSGWRCWPDYRVPAISGEDPRIPETSAAGVDAGRTVPRRPAARSRRCRSPRTQATVCPRHGPAP